MKRVRSESELKDEEKYWNKKGLKSGLVGRVVRVGGRSKQNGGG